MNSESAQVRSRARTIWLLLAAFLIFATGGVVTISSTTALLQARDWTEHTLEVLAEVDGLSSASNDVVAASRGYALTGRPTLLEELHLAARSAAQRLEHLADLTEDNSREQIRVAELRQLIVAQVSEANTLVDARSVLAHSAAGPIPHAAAETATADRIRSLLQSARADELGLLQTRRDAVRHQTVMAFGFEVLLGLLSVLVVAVVAWRLRHDGQALAAAQRVALAAREERAASMTALEGRTALLTTLSELSSVLGICLTRPELHMAVSATLARAIPGCAGALGVINNDRLKVELPVTWGMEPVILEAYSPVECCALRSGRTFGGEPGGMTIICAHGRLSIERNSLCVPLAAQGETHGVLHLWLPAGMTPVDAARCRELVTLIGEQLALAMANLSARDALSQQATRDPLTGAYNRRFMIEALDREVLRGRRTKRAPGLLMVDVDHFKRFNDDFGHQAGDEVLKQVVKFIQSSVRAEDYVCRYGGEEFAVVLPEASVTAAAKRAEEIRHLIETSCRTIEGGVVTVSIGVATYAADSHELIQRADQMLYRAKEAGRNRVEVLGVDILASAPLAA